MSKIVEGLKAAVKHARCDHKWIIISETPERTIKQCVICEGTETKFVPRAR